MSIARSQGRLELPQGLRWQLGAFRRRVWALKSVEAACAAAFGVLAAFLLLYGLDRLWDTPHWPRAVLFALAVIAIAGVPLAFYRWVWRQRRLDQLARLLARKHPRVGDQLLGVIELAESDTEQARSRRLCEAAIEQVAEDAKSRDLADAVPNPRHRPWAALATAALAGTVTLCVLYPDATRNAWARLLAPWKAVPRYTFAAVNPLPERVVVPHGEPFTITATLAEGSAWHPSQGIARLGSKAVGARLEAGRYAFALPPQIDAGTLEIRVGDSLQRLRVEPTLRPELTSVMAVVNLPAYLERPKPEHKDVRGGNISLVRGSQARFAATASRALAHARVDGQPRAFSGATVSSPPLAIEGSRKLVFSWRDRLGLSGKEPFTLTIHGRDDENPTVACEGLPRQKVVLDSEQLSFQVRAQDDFGIKRVGLEWRGIDDQLLSAPAEGEKYLAAGGSEKTLLEAAGTFSAKSLGIDPQPIQLRIFAEDYFPGRERTYSPAYTLYILNLEQHAIWLTEQLSKWHRKSLEVRDREMRLLETNKQIRDLPPEELDRPETRKRIENQAAAERANGRRLSSLVTSGEDLVQQAMRNPEFGVGHLEKWAEMLQILKDISANRMPSVADLLDQGARAPVSTAKSSNPQSPMAGQVRSTGSGSPSDGKLEPKGSSAVPQLVDQESSQQSPDDKPASQQASSSGSPRLGLPQTTLVGKGSDSASCPTGQKVAEAVQKQQDLLAEFEKVADELNRILGNLEGSTLVKRLKAASRHQYQIAGRIADHVEAAFGHAPVEVADQPSKVLNMMIQEEARESQTVSTIMDDMQSYFERRRFLRFKTVLDEMRAKDVVGSLRQIGDDLKKESGLSIAQCEFWSDTLDRWAEDLVDPASGGT